MAHENHHGFKKILHVTWSIFLNGLFTLLPLTLTIALFRFSFKLIKGWLAPVERLASNTFLINFPHSEIIIVLLFIFVVGLILRFFFLKPLIHAIEELIFRVPLVRPIYSGIKQLVDAFNMQEEKLTIKRVVLVEFPRNGIYSVGFLTGQLPESLAPNNQHRYFNVFIPTTPNPTTGFYIMVPEHQIIESDLTRQEGMSLIISGGIILPERFERKAE
jgi:uncharacterized membrane protein